MRKNKIAGMVTALVLTAAMLTGCGSATGNGNAGRGVQASTSAATQTTESSVAPYSAASFTDPKNISFPDIPTWEPNNISAMITPYFGNFFSKSIPVTTISLTQSGRFYKQLLQQKESLRRMVSRFLFP
jgi:predicted small secreted protein